VTPLVIGDRSALTPELNARLRASGLVHLLALSGLHVTWLASLARGASATLGGGPRVRALSGGLCALLYVGVAGPLPSLMRAAAGELLLAAARLLDRALDPVQALGLSALLLLAWAPGWAADLGFQLSFAATLGLVAIGPWLEARCRRLGPLARPFVPTLSAQITATPLLLARFHALSWVGALANFAAVPVSGLLLAAGCLAAAVECALPGTAGIWFDACEALAAALRGIAEWAASAPGAMFAAGHEPGMVACAGLGAALLSLALPEARDVEGRRRPASRARVAGGSLGAILVALALLLASSAPVLRPPPGRWWLVALDVGQGDALALGFEDGWWMVDAGPRNPHYDAGEAVVLPFLRWAGVRRVESLVLTHDDGDHIGGAFALRRGVAVERTLAPAPLPGVPGPAGRFGAAPLARPDAPRVSPAARVLWPPRPDAPGAAGIHADNGAALVLELGGGEARALLLADVDSTVEESLAIRPGVALLKVAHHGAASSSGSRFLDRLRPRDALLSVGRHNPFGHPDPHTLRRLAAAGARLHRTDVEGALWFELDTAGVRRIDWRRGPRDERATSAGAGLARPPARW
jgi:competence protein ComEC